MGGATSAWFSPHIKHNLPAELVEHRSRCQHGEAAALTDSAAAWGAAHSVFSGCHGLLFGRATLRASVRPDQPGTTRPSRAAACRSVEAACAHRQLAVSSARLPGMSYVSLLGAGRRASRAGCPRCRHRSAGAVVHQLLAIPVRPDHIDILIPQRKSPEPEVVLVVLYMYRYMYM